MFSIKDFLLEGTPEENKYTGRMVAFYVDPKIGPAIQDAFADIPGEIVQPEDMHITIGLIENEDEKVDELVKKVLSSKIAPKLSPFKVEFDGFDTFEPSDSSDRKTVLWARPKSDDLFKVHKLVFDELKKYGVKVHNGNFDFKPHTTIKYCDEPPVIRKRCRGSCPMNKISFAKKGDVFDFELGRKR